MNQNQKQAAAAAAHAAAAAAWRVTAEGGNWSGAQDATRIAMEDSQGTNVEEWPIEGGAADKAHAHEEARDAAIAAIG